MHLDPRTVKPLDQPFVATELPTPSLTLPGYSFHSTTANNDFEATFPTSAPFCDTPTRLEALRQQRDDAQGRLKALHGVDGEQMVKLFLCTYSN